MESNHRNRSYVWGLLRTAVHMGFINYPNEVRDNDLAKCVDRLVGPRDEEYRGIGVC